MYLQRTEDNLLHRLRTSLRGKVSWREMKWVEKMVEERVDKKAGLMAVCLVAVTAAERVVR